MKVGLLPGFMCPTEVCERLFCVSDCGLAGPLENYVCSFHM